MQTTVLKLPSSLTLAPSFSASLCSSFKMISSHHLPSHTIPHHTTPHHTTPHHTTPHRAVSFYQRDEDMIQDLQEEQRAGVWSIFRQAPQHKRKRHRRKAAEILKNPIPSLNEAMDAILAIVVLLFLTYMYDEEFYWSIIDMTIRPVKVALGYEEYSADAADGIRPDGMGRPPKR